MNRLQQEATLEQQNLQPHQLFRNLVSLRFPSLAGSVPPLQTTIILPVEPRMPCRFVLSTNTGAQLHHSVKSPTIMDDTPDQPSNVPASAVEFWYPRPDVDEEVGAFPEPRQLASCELPRHKLRPERAIGHNDHHNDVPLVDATLVRTSDTIVNTGVAAGEGADADVSAGAGECARANTLESETSEVEKKHSEKSNPIFIRPKQLYLTVGIVVVLLVFAVVASLVGVNIVQSTAQTARFEALKAIVLNVSRNDALEDTSSPQYRALDWLARIDDGMIPINKVDSVIQRYTLSVFYFSTGGESWTFQNEFLTNKHECDWYYFKLFGRQGVKCNGNQRVTMLKLPSNKMIGTIPMELASLSQMRHLSLWGNDLDGSIPTQLGTLTKLAILALSENKLKGSIPSEFENLSELQWLWLNGNELTGSVNSLCNMLGELSWLTVDRNEVDCNCCMCC